MQIFVIWSEVSWKLTTIMSFFQVQALKLKHETKLALKSSMNTVLFVNANIMFFSENLLLVQEVTPVSNTRGHPFL